MDYSKSTGVKIMMPIAEEAGCEYQPFSQMAVIRGVEAKIGELVNGGGGICYGLAVAWLEATEKNGGDFLGQVADFERSPIFYRAYMSFRHQETFASFNNSDTLSIGTWTESTRGRTDWKPRDRFFGSSAVTQNSALSDTGKSKTFGSSEADMRAFCSWLAAASGRRYFLVHVPGHTMAATGSRWGNYSFFDPNCGIISSSSQKTMAKCLSGFFNNEKIKSAYKNSSKNNWMRVEKFKA